MNRNDSVKCTIADGVLTIQIGVDALAHATKLNPELTEYDEATEEWIEPEIVDIDVFAGEVLRALKDETDDGTTVVHLMLDNAVNAAIENGAEGINLPDDIIRERRKAAKQLIKSQRPEGQ
jgi:ABC-type histidine transport system ATPase subunit